ncbi:MAG: metallophosphoesterase family protein [Pseudomonadota bacterium]
MQIAVISDIHGNIGALEAALADIDRHGITEVLNLGDSFSGPFDAGAVADLLMARAIPQVMGNHDRFLIDRAPEEMDLWERWAYPLLTTMHLDWIRSFRALDERHGIVMSHGQPGDDNANWLHRRAQDGSMQPASLEQASGPAEGIDNPVILSGHTHLPRAVRVPDGPLLVNPGSIGCPAYFNDDIDPPLWAEMGAPDASYAILEQAGGTWRASFHTVLYDTAPMIALARQNDAEPWARALETGWAPR